MLNKPGYMKKYYAEHKEQAIKHKEYMKKWRETHKEYMKTYNTKQTKINVRLDSTRKEKLKRLIKEYGIRNKSIAIRLALDFYFKNTIDMKENTNA